MDFLYSLTKIKIPFIDVYNYSRLSLLPSTINAINKSTYNESIGDDIISFIKLLNPFDNSFTIIMVSNYTIVNVY